MRRLRTTVSYLDKKFTVNGKKVKCELTYGINLQKCPLIMTTICKNAYVFKNFFKSGRFVDYRITKNALYALFTATGTASCSDKDVFDETTGRRIAETAAQRKAFAMASKLYIDYVDCLDEEIKRAYKYYRNCGYTAHVANKHIEKLGL